MGQHEALPFPARERERREGSREQQQPSDPVLGTPRGQQRADSREVGRQQQEDEVERQVREVAAEQGNERRDRQRHHRGEGDGGQRRAEGAPGYRQRRRNADRSDGRRHGVSAAGRLFTARIIAQEPFRERYGRRRSPPPAAIVRARTRSGGAPGSPRRRRPPPLRPATGRGGQ